jgi:hypothetical protein
MYLYVSLKDIIYYLCDRNINKDSDYIVYLVDGNILRFTAYTSAETDNFVMFSNVEME